jgi:biopolymer transport protein ExbD
MAISMGSAEGEPIMDINTTPLIDVMLVMLIMVIMSIPIQTHAVKIDLPVPSDAPPPPVDPIKNKIVITANGAVLWNGTAVDLNVLRTELDKTTNMTPTPELHIQPESEARYETVDEVMAVVKRANITSMGFVGNEAYRTF